MPVARRADHSSTSSTARAADSFHLLDEIEQSLALDVTPTSWPIGMRRDLLSTYDLLRCGLFGRELLPKLVLAKVA